MASSLGAAQTAVNATTQSLSSAGTIAGSTNGAPAREKDRAEAQTAPQFGEVIQNIQAKYGARPEKGREIKKTLGKDDFLRIMVTQMKNQDPTKPFDAEQMASQMAQFTTVEQLKNMGDAMNKMSTANQPLERMAMTNMIGKTITVDRGRFPHTEGTNDSLSFGLPSDAQEVTVSLINEQGETVLRKELGKTKAGESSFTWDGKKTNTLPAKSGNYMLKVDAVDANGARIETNSQTQARVIGVSFEGAEPVFLVGDAQRQEKVTMKNVVRIDEAVNGSAASAPAAPKGEWPQQSLAQAMAAAQAQMQGQGSAGSAQSQATGEAPGAGAAKGGKPFFTFQKGVGSTPLDPSQAAAAQRAMASYQQQNAAPAAAPAVDKDSSKGFPNGLQDN